MGWLRPEEQNRIRRKKHMQALYLCDFCHKPIRIGEAPVIDPKGGYHQWPKTVPKACRTLSAREPKVTYHYQCDRIRRGKAAPKPKEEKKHHHKKKHHRHHRRHHHGHSSRYR